MNTLGEVIRVLMSRRQLTGAQLAEDIGLSATSVSRIITGHSKPKQVTLTRLMKRLCVGAEEEQMLLRAFTGTNAPKPEEPLGDDPRNSMEERERVERWLEARTQAITFKEAVARELDKRGISYRRDACDGIGSTDFLIETGQSRVALECKFNVSRDFDKTLGIARLLLDLFACEKVIVVVPFVGEFANAAKEYGSAVHVLSVPEAIGFVEDFIRQPIKET